MQVMRDVVRSPTGERFVIAYAPSRGIDTKDLYAGRLFLFRHYAPLLDFIGWVRHRTQGKGRWTVAGARLGSDGRATALIHSSYAPDRRSAQQAAKSLKRHIQTGAATY